MNFFLRLLALGPFYQILYFWAVYKFLVTLDNENMLACVGEYSFRKRRALWEFERIYMAVREVLQLLTLFERELLQDIFFLGLSFREAGEKRGISKSTCFRLYKKILNKIRKMLDERGIKFTFEDDDL